MAKSVPTIYDVADHSGVSISTVSRVINSPEKVNEKTLRLVLDTISQLGFVPKADARARALKGNRRIGVITPFFTAPSFVQRLRGVASALQGTKNELVIYTVDSSDSLKSYLETLPLTHSLDGLIILSLQFNNHYAQRLADSGLESVLVEFPHDSINSVEIDDVLGGQLAAEYLIKKGYKEFAFAGDTIIPEFGIHPITLRLSGFRQGLKAKGYRLKDEAILITPYDTEITSQNAFDFLRSAKYPLGFFAATDLQAIGIMKAGRKLGLCIPQDLGILGFDDLDVAEYVGLSTIRQHLDESGRVAVELLLSRINDRNRPVQHIKLPLTVIERETV